MGGGCVLSLLGARLGRNEIHSFCESQNEPSAFLYRDVLSKLLGDTTGGLDSCLKDHRVKAAVVLAPFTSVFNRESLSRIRTPLKVYMPRCDTVLPFEQHGFWLQTAGPNCDYTMLNDGDHFVFASPKKENWLAPTRRKEIVAGYVWRPDHDERDKQIKASQPNKCRNPRVPR